MNSGSNVITSSLPVGESGPSEEKLTETFYIMLMFILFAKQMIEAYFEKVQPPFGHNTGIIIIMGMICSYAIYKMAGD